jgi:hypothetical protein
MFHSIRGCCFLLLHPIAGMREIIHTSQKLLYLHYKQTGDDEIPDWHTHQQKSYRKSMKPTQK